jgi:hypothetical protein
MRYGSQEGPPHTILALKSSLSWDRSADVGRTVRGRSPRPPPELLPSRFLDALLLPAERFHVVWIDRLLNFVETKRSRPSRAYHRLEPGIGTPAS